MPQENLIDYTIVICTYNPDERLLKRCLQAVLNLDSRDIATEVILVDNNSLVPVDNLLYVREYVNKIPSMKTILAAKQGVKYARIAAIKQAKGKYIVYFDYDNEPQDDYLQELKKINAQYPQAGAVGPGNITVDFIDGIDKKIESYARIAFQEKHEEAIKFSGVREWQPCYPFGTGLCTQAFLLKEYVSLAENKTLTMPGRQGNQLTSGEDTQMVLYCISKGFFAGISPTLKLTHIIPAERTNYQYLQKLAYGTGLCYYTSLLQVFPEHINKVKKEFLSPVKFSRRTLKQYVAMKLRPEKIFDFIQFIALNAGAYMALKKDVPVVVKKVIKNLKLG